MLNAFSSLKGLELHASDGRLGTVVDLLFEDTSWKVRWVVVDTGGWLNRRNVLIHPSAVTSAGRGAVRVDVALSMAQVEGSPEIGQDRPVSRRMEEDTYAYYGWDPLWSGGMFAGGMYGGMSGIASPVSAPALFGAGAAHEAGHVAGHTGSSLEEGDPHLRSVAEVTGYHVHATDGDIGHVQDFLVDQASWGVRYLVVDTSNWWFGQHVLVSPHAIKEVDWSERHVLLVIVREQVKSSPPWTPSENIDDAYEQRLQNHYDWPRAGDEERAAQAGQSASHTVIHTP